jgi:hypothetical protein
MINQINSSGGAIVTISAGTFYVKGSQLPPITAPCTIQGSGAGAHDAVDNAVVNVVFNTTVTQIINVENSSSVFVFSTGASGSKIMDLRLSYTGSALPVNGSYGIKQNIFNGGWCHYERVLVEGFYIGIDIWRGQSNTIVNCKIVGNLLGGIRLNNLDAMDYGDNRIVNNFFYGPDALNSIGLAAIIWQSGSGIVITGNKWNVPQFPGGAYGYGIAVLPQSVGTTANPDGTVYVADPSGQNFGLGVAIISDNSIENIVFGGILGVVPALTPLGDFGIHDNEFLVAAVTPGQDFVVNNQSAQGTGYKVGDILTVSYSSISGAWSAVTNPQVQVDAISGTGAITAWHSIKKGTADAGHIGIHPRGYIGFPIGVTGGNGTGATFGSTPIYNIAFINYTQNIGALMVHDNRSYSPGGGFYVQGGTAGGVIGKNYWTSADQYSAGVFLDSYGPNIANCLFDTMPATMFNTSTTAPAGIIFSSSNEGAYDSNRTATAPFGNKIHEYMFPVLQAAVNVQVNCFTIIPSSYSGITLDIEFSGTEVISAVDTSLYAKFRRAVTLESGSSTAALTVMDTDVGLIGGASNAPSNASNVWTIGSGTNSFQIGIVPQTGNGKVYIYVKATGTNVTGIGGKLLIRARGAVSEVAYGNI